MGYEYYSKLLMRHFCPYQGCCQVLGPKSQVQVFGTMSQISSLSLESGAGSTVACSGPGLSAGWCMHGRRQQSSSRNGRWACYLWRWQWHIRYANGSGGGGRPIGTWQRDSDKQVQVMSWVPSPCQNPQVKYESSCRCDLCWIQVTTPHPWPLLHSY